ncbi:SDR family NAD(P)-dependent oxidoreductase [Paracoccus sp. N5]|uniref:SDR family NAD(P)-dependent oxidoreductase n=1 Tax=Paracoccus sp. N5 TaxID=1101189 RepID=UPI000477A3FA|nr:SDR family NAD(P)-dependent oxidoreductase [Paracoccus sp. N5]
MRLQDKRVVVTAAASGMGRAGCLLFAQEGATVAVVDIDPARTEQVVAEVIAQGGKARGFVADLSSAEACKHVIAECAEWLGGIDLLWAHAGSPGPSAVEGVDIAAFDFAVALNLTSALICAGEVADHMRRAGGGAILFTASVAGLRGSPLSPVYSALKFGVVGFTKSLARRYARDGIRVNVVCPGAVDTPMLPAFLDRDGNDDELRAANQARLVANVPMGRVARPEEIAHAALWLLSDDASFVNGVALPVDGGYAA